jgi:hypothetical protein
MAGIGQELIHRNIPAEINAMSAEAESNADSPVGDQDFFDRERYVWVFQWSTRPSIHAATLDNRARNLPQHFASGGSWVLNGQLIIGPHTHSSLGIDIVALRCAINANGYYLWNADIEMPEEIGRLMR